jgi:hypothetical protein
VLNQPPSSIMGGMRTPDQRERERERERQSEREGDRERETEREFERSMWDKLSHLCAHRVCLLDSMPNADHSISFERG